MDPGTRQRLTHLQQMWSQHISQKENVCITGFPLRRRRSDPEKEGKGGTEEGGSPN